MFGLQGVLTGMLNSILGDYIVLDDDALSLALTSGKVNLTNLRFKAEALLDLNLPITVTAGSLGRLHVELPWTDLWGSPTRVEIEDVFILAKPKKNVFDDEFERRLQITKQRFLDLHELTKGDVPVAENETEEEAAKRVAEEAKKSKEGGPSWTERLVATIIRNLQVTVKNVHIRYEDDESNTHCFAVGVTLASLDAQSADVNWLASIVKNATDQVARKLCSLRNLCVYWNSHTEKIKFDSPKQFAVRMREMIYQDQQEVTADARRHQFILHPLCGELRATVDLGSKPDLSKPKIQLRSTFEEIRVGLHQQQYEDVIRMGDSMSRESRGMPYRQLRPQIEPPNRDRPGSGLTWFRYAVNAVLQDVRAPKKVWSWEYLKQATADRREYIRLWYAKLRGREQEEMEKERLAALEFRLEYEVIIEHRRVAEALWKRQKKKAEDVAASTYAKEGWIGTVWSNSGSAKKKVLEEELDFSPELLQGVGKDLNRAAKKAAETVTLPPTYVKMALDFKLKKGAVVLGDFVDATQPALPLMDMHFDVLTVRMQQRETSSSINIGIASLELLEFVTLEGEPRVMIKPSAEHLELLQLAVDVAPLDGHADTAVSLKARPLDVVFSMRFIDRVVLFFQSATGSVLDELIESAQDTAASLQQKAAMQLKYSLEEESRLDLKIDVEAPNIVVPLDFRSRDCPRLVLVMGNVLFSSDLEAKANAMVVRDGRKHVSADYFYQKFVLAINKTQLMMVRHENWRQYVKDVTLCHIVEDLSLSMDLRVLSFPTNALPAIKISGRLTSPLNGNLGGNKVAQVLSIIDSMFPPPSEEKKREMEAKLARIAQEEARRERNRKLRAETSGEEEEENDFRSLLPSAKDGHDKLKEEQDSGLVIEEGLLDGGDNPASMTLDFAIPDVSLLLYRRNDPSDDRSEHTEVVQLKLGHFALDFQQRLQDMEVTLSLGGLGIVDKVQTFGPDFEWLVDGIYDANGPLSETEFLHLTYRGVPRKSPLYEGTEHVVALAVSSINVNINRATVLYLLDFINIMVAGMAKEDDAKEEEDGKEQEERVILLLEDEEHAEATREGPAPSVTPAATPAKVILDVSQLAKINASLGTVSLSLSKEHPERPHEGARFLVTTVQGASAEVAMRNNGSMKVVASLGSLEVVNESSSKAAWKRILHTKDGDERSVDIVFQTFLPEVHGYPGYDTYFKLSMSSLSAVFKNVLVQEVVQYFAQMDEMKRYISTQTTKAATQAVEKSGKMLLDITVANPYIIVPEASNSDSMLLVDLGVITVYTQYEGEGPTESQKMSITIQQLNLTTGKRSEEEREAILCNTDLVVFITLPVDAGAHQLPDTGIHGTMTEMGISFNETQLGVLFGILGGNLAETYEDTTESSYERQARIEAIDDEESEQEKEERLSQPLAIVDDRVWKTLALNFSFQQFSLTLNRVEEGPLASFEINSLSTVMTQLSDASMKLSVDIAELVFLDLRPEAGESYYRRILAPVKTEESSSKLIKVAMSTSPSGFMAMKIDVENFRINLILECIWALVSPETGFVTTQLAKLSPADDDKGKEDEVGGVEGKEEEQARVVVLEEGEGDAGKQDAKVPESPPSMLGKHRGEPVEAEQKGGMHVQVIVRHPEFALIEDPLDAKSRAILIGGTICTEYLSTADGGQNINLELRDFTIVKQVSSGPVKLVPPWNVTFSYMVVPREHTSIEITLAVLKTVLSYSDFRLLFRMYLRSMRVLKSASDVEAEEKEAERRKEEAQARLTFESTSTGLIAMPSNVRPIRLAGSKDDLVATVHHKEREEDTEIAVTLESLRGSQVSKQNFLYREQVIALKSEPTWVLAVRSKEPHAGDKVVLVDMAQEEDSHFKWEVEDSTIRFGTSSLQLAFSEDAQGVKQLVLAEEGPEWDFSDPSVVSDAMETVVSAVSTEAGVETLSLAWKGFQVQMIDDSQGSIERILKLEMGQTDLLLSSWSTSMRGVLTSSLGVNFFNIGVQAWEPLLRGLEAPSKELPYGAVVAHEREWAFQLQIRNVKQAMSLVLSGERAISVSVSRSMMETVENLQNTWSFADLNEEGAQPHQELKERTPYRIRNRTGRVIEWSVGALGAHSLSPDAGRNDVDWAPDATLDNAEVSGHVIGFRVGGIPTPLSGLSMERIGSYAFNLNGPVLVYDVEYEHGTRILTLRSNVLLVNECLHRVSVLADTGMGKTVLCELEPAERYPIPLHYLQHRLHLQANDEDTRGHGYDYNVKMSRAIELTKLKLVTEEGVRGRRATSLELVCPGEEVSFAFALKVEGEPDRLAVDAMSWKITMGAPLKVRNMMPLDIEYRIIDMAESKRKVKHQTVYSSAVIPSADFVEVFCSRPKTQWGLSIRVVGGEWSFPVPVAGTGTPAAKVELLTHPESVDFVVDIMLDRMVEGHAHQVTMFVPFLLLNRTGLSALWSSQDFLSRKKKQSVGGQSEEGHASWLAERTELPFHEWYEELPERANLLFYSGGKIAFTVADSKPSDTMQLAQASDEGVMTLRSEDSTRQYEVSVATFSAPGSYWRSKVVQLTNRYVLVNRTGRALLVSQVGVDEPVPLANDTQVAFHWPNGDLPLLLHARLEGEGWGYSSPFDIKAVSLFEVRAENASQEQRVSMTVQTTTEGTKTAVIFRPSDPDCSLYVVSNKTPFPIRITQHTVEDDEGVVVAPSSERNYVWANCAVADKRVCVSVDHGKVVPTGILSSKEELSFPFDAMETYKPISVERDNGSFICLPQVYFRGMTKVFELRWNRQEAVAAQEDPVNVVSLSLELRLVGLGLAVITNEPKEFLHVFCEDISFVYEDGDRETTMEADVKRLQIDSMVYNAVYPILWWPKNGPERHFLHFAVNEAKGYDGVTFLNLLNFTMQEVDLMVDEALLTTAVKAMGVLFARDADLGPLAENIARDTRNFCKGEITVSDMVYCRWLEIGPMKVNLSYSTAPWAAVSLEGESLERILNMMGHMSELDQAPLVMNSLILENPFQARSDLVQVVTDHYVKQLLRGFYLLLGSLPMLGSPVQLVGSIGTGFKDFFIEPAMGLTRSPKDFGVGLRKGTTSLIKGTLGGVTNSLSKVTGVLGNAAALATFDAEYQMERDRSNKRQAKHAGEGILFGARDFGKGLWAGISGVVINPIKGAQRDGALGLVKGIGSGLVGIVTKPLAGTFDMTTRLTQGIRNTTIYAEMAKRKRVRRPRYFGQFLVLEDFSGLHAEGQEILYSIRESMHMAEYYCFHYPYLNAKRVVDRKEMKVDNRVLVSNKHVFYLKGVEIYSIDIVWRIALQNIIKVVRVRNGIIIIESGKRDTVREIPTANEVSANYIYYALQESLKGGNVAQATQLELVHSGEEAELRPRRSGTIIKKR